MASDAFSGFDVKSGFDVGQKMGEGQSGTANFVDQLTQRKKVYDQARMDLQGKMAFARGSADIGLVQKRTELEQFPDLEARRAGGIARAEEAGKVQGVLGAYGGADQYGGGTAMQTAPPSQNPFGVPQSQGGSVNPFRAGQGVQGNSGINPFASVLQRRTLEGAKAFDQAQGRDPGDYDYQLGTAAMPGGLALPVYEGKLKPVVDTETTKDILDLRQQQATMKNIFSQLTPSIRAQMGPLAPGAQPGGWPTRYLNVKSQFLQSANTARFAKFKQDVDQVFEAYKQKIQGARGGNLQSMQWLLKDLPQAADSDTVFASKLVGVLQKMDRAQKEILTTEKQKGNRTGDLIRGSSPVVLPVMDKSTRKIYHMLVGQINLNRHSLLLPGELGQPSAPMEGGI